jgi:hypothetical protein
MRAVGSQIYSHDLKREGVFHVLISAVGWHMDGGRRFFPLGSLDRDRAQEAPWMVAREGSSIGYSAQNAMRFLPMWPRLWEELVLRTHHGENGPWEAGDGEAAPAVFNGGGDDVWWLTGSKDSSGSGGVGEGSSSKWWIGAAARRQCHGSVMTARVQSNSHGIGHYL